MVRQDAPTRQALGELPVRTPQVPQPKQPEVRSPSETKTEEVSTSSSSLTSVYLDEDSPFHVKPRSKVKLFLPCEDDASIDTAKPDPSLELRRNQIDYWNRSVIKRSVALGPRHLRTAEALMDLGSAQLMAQEYTAAIRSYTSAVKIFREKYGDMHLSVARALDKVGLATSMSGTNLDSALETLMGALKIRCELLGNEHVDSVDSFNNLAGAHLNRGEFATAAQLYRVVMRHREQIFGRYHASVGVTAYTLACILDDRLDQGKDALAYFQLAKEIYKALGMVKTPYYIDACARLREHSKLLEI